MVEARTYEPPQREGPQGIGGWLILPVIGLAVTPLQGLAQLWQYVGLSENFRFLSAGQLTFVWLEILANLVIVIGLPLYLLYLLFNKKVGFPGVYVWWAILNLGFIVADLVAAKMLFGEVFAATGTDLIDEETMRAIVRGLALVGIWVPYMLNSRRVKNTFIQ